MTIKNLNNVDIGSVFLDQGQLCFASGRDMVKLTLPKSVMKVLGDIFKLQGQGFYVNIDGLDIGNTKILFDDNLVSFGQSGKRPVKLKDITNKTFDSIGKELIKLSKVL